MESDIYMYLILTMMLVVIIYLAWRVSEFKKVLENMPRIKSERTDIQESLDGKAVDSFFISNEARLIFVLLYVESEERSKLLGITEEMYESIELAKSWKSKIVKQIHPDRCKHPQANEAMSKINSIYARMKKYGE